MAHSTPLLTVAVLASFAVTLLAATLTPTPLSAQDGKVVVVFYEVTDLLRKVPDFPAPKLGLDGLEPTDTGGLFDEEEDDPTWTLDDLVELIRSHCFPDSWEQAGISIVGQRGVIIVTHREDVQFEAARYFQKLRRRYRVEARVVALTPEALARFVPRRRDGAPRKKNNGNTDVAPLDDLGTVTQITARHFNRRMTQLVKNGQAELLSTPRLTVHDGQLAHFLLVEQQARVSDSEVDEETGIANPVVSTLEEGMVIEVRAERGPSSSVTHLAWSIRTARAEQPMERVELEGEHWSGTVATPVVRQSVLQGNSYLKRGTVLMIRGFEQPGNHAADDRTDDGTDDGEARREVVLFLKCSRLGQPL